MNYFFIWCCTVFYHTSSENWIKEAEEKADELWNKDQEQVRLFFKGNDERKSIGIISSRDMVVFDRK